MPPSRPESPAGATNYVILILDSCRWDSFVAAKPKRIPKLGPVQKRYSYATWTSPSHYNLLMGLLPHSSPRHIYASEYYKSDFLRFKERLGAQTLSFSQLLPSLWLPTLLQEQLGYRTNLYASMPVLNPATPLNRSFDRFELMEQHNDAAQIYRRMRFYDDRPSFFMLNTGETHYPYATPDEPEAEWPRLSGVNGVLKRLDEHLRGGNLVHLREAPGFFDAARMAELRERQIRAVQWVDRGIEELFDLLPANTYVTVTADHGEMFGESGYFGHGPIQHRKCTEVPFVEGRLR